MIYPHIRCSSRFYGKFEVAIDAKISVPCYNLATARSILRELKNKKRQER